MEKIIKDFSKELIREFHNNFVENESDNDDYFNSIILLINGNESYLKKNRFNDSICVSIKKELLDFAYNLFLNHWLSQAKQSAGEGDEFDFNEDNEIKDCYNEFYSWFDNNKFGNN